MPPDQGRILYDEMDALAEAVRALGGPKKIGVWLRPDLPVDQATSWVRDRLNINRRERFDPTQVFAILRRARDAGYHEAFTHIAERCGYRAEPIEPENERARLQREFIDSVQRLESIREALGRVEPQVRAGK